MTLTTGYILNNRYRIVKLLGQGGFGAIYRAWDLNLRTPCAIKHNTETSPQAERQFVREATLLANLNHPHLPRVVDYFFLPQQGQYLVMDYIEGEDLQDKLDHAAAANGVPTPLPIDQVLVWIGQVADALSYLHHLSPPIIHRDIKPANIRITSEGKAYLVDFGIAKAYNPHVATTIAAKAVTPGYSPPEQYSGVGTDIRTDIYALGATLYTLVTAEQPPESVFRTTGHETLRLPRSINPNISPGLQSVIMKAMEISSGSRFQDIGEMRAALANPYYSAPVAPTARMAGEPFVQSYPQQTSAGSAAYPQSAAQSYPGGAVQPYPESAAGQPRAGSKLWMILAIGAFVLVCLILTGLLLRGVIADQFNVSTERPSSTERPTYTAYPTYTELPATDIPRPTNTTRSTEPPQPSATLRPTDPPTATSVPTRTRTPVPTQPPVTNISVRIRNRTAYNVNLYRHGLSGEVHFLGWLVPGYYGIYTFPSLDNWTIEYCRRDDNGDSYNCKQKSINVTADNQEFNVP